MGKTDNITKKYMQRADIFADAFNACLFNGERVVDPDALCELDTSVVAAPFGSPQDAKATDTSQKYRDVLKQAVIKTDGRASYILLGIESQTLQHYAMPVRNMLYDAMQYQKQIDEIKSKRKKTSGSSDKFLSGLTAEDKIIPVITLVVLFSPDKWTAPKSMSEMFVNVDDRLKPFVQDYKIFILSPDELAERDMVKFGTSLKEVMYTIKYMDDYSTMRDFIGSDETFRSIDTDAAIIIKEITHAKFKVNEKSGVTNMCLAMQEMERKCMSVGEEIGEKRGFGNGKIAGGIEVLKGIGFSKADVCKKLIEMFSLDSGTAEKYIVQYWN